MPVNVGPSDADRYGWPGTPGEVLSAEATRIARHIARAGAAVVGLLPIDGRRPLDDRLAPVLLRLAEAPVSLADGDVACRQLAHLAGARPSSGARLPPTAAAGCSAS
jgi:hypothetical protein